MAKVVVDRLLDDIAAGRYQPGSRLPTEPELCTMMGVSRATLREAMKALQQLGVTSIEQGRGTFVTPVQRWSPFHPALLAARTSTIDGHLDEHWSAKLIELRRMVEVGVAGLAAARRRDEDLAEMGAALEAMRRTQAGDVTAFAAADLAFHQAVMKAADNELVQALFDPIHRLIEAARLESSLPARRRAHAIEAHTSILAAIESGDAAAASAAMRDHLDSTFTWVRSHAAGETERGTVPAGDAGRP